MLTWLYLPNLCSMTRAPGQFLVDSARQKPSHWVRKPAYLVPVPSQDKLAGKASSIKMGDVREVGR